MPNIEICIYNCNKKPKIVFPNHITNLKDLITNYNYTNDVHLTHMYHQYTKGFLNFWYISLYFKGNQDNFIEISLHNETFLVKIHCLNKIFLPYKKVVFVKNNIKFFKQHIIPETLVLCGGAVHGISILGCLYPLSNMSFKYLYGTSIGAIICFLLSIGYLPEEIFQEFLKIDIGSY